MSNIFYDYHRRDEGVVQQDREYSKILSAAVINEKFRKLLLTNPGVAIKKGFGGEAFNLGSEDTRRISSIRVATLAEFARQMNAGLSQPSAAVLE